MNPSSVTRRFVLLFALSFLFQFFNHDEGSHVKLSCSSDALLDVTYVCFAVISAALTSRSSYSVHALTGRLQQVFSSLLVSFKCMSFVPSLQ